MDQPDQDRPLREIETLSSDVLRAAGPTRRAHPPAPVGAPVHRGGAAVPGRVLRDDEAAAELAQEFAVRVLAGTSAAQPSAAGSAISPDRGPEPHQRLSAADQVRHLVQPPRPSSRSPPGTMPMSPTRSSSRACAGSYSAGLWPRWTRTRGGPAGPTTTSSAFGPVSPSPARPRWRQPYPPGSANP